MLGDFSRPSATMASMRALMMKSGSFFAFTAVIAVDTAILLFTLNRRFSKSLQFGLSYTFSKYLDYSSIPLYRPIKQWSYGFNGADLRNVCTEAGMFAIRAESDFVKEEDFMKAVRDSGCVGVR